MAVVLYIKCGWHGVEWVNQVLGRRQIRYPLGSCANCTWNVCWTYDMGSRNGTEFPLFHNQIE